MQYLNEPIVILDSDDEMVVEEAVTEDRAVTIVKVENAPVTSDMQTPSTSTTQVIIVNFGCSTKSILIKLMGNLCLNLILILIFVFFIFAGFNRGSNGGRTSCH